MYDIWLTVHPILHLVAFIYPSTNFHVCVWLFCNVMAVGKCLPHYKYLCIRHVFSDPIT